MKVTQPGIYTEFPTDAYFADPTPDPSLTQSIAKTLLNQSPRHAWFNSPRLNPNYKEPDEKKFDLGSAAHKHLIGRGTDLGTIDADDYRTKAAQQAREAIIAAGMQPILAWQNERAVEMVQAIRRQLKAAGHSEAFCDGDGEVMVAWRDGDIWCRTLIDWLPRDKRIVWDLKTTTASAAPHALPMKMAQEGWAVQAAMHERGLNLFDPDNAGRRKHRFVCVECEEPYALTITEIPESAMTMGRKMLEMAMYIWRDCILHDRWPGYPKEIQRPEFPQFKEAAILAREVEHYEKRTAA